MPHYSETRLLPYSPAQLFGLVVDIEQYPQFLPWCRGARIVSREGESFLGELVVSFSHITERYTSRVTPTLPSLPPQAGGAGGGNPAIESDSSAPSPTRKQSSELFAPPPAYGGGLQEHRIEVTLVSGPFNYLNNHWRFIPHTEGCEIHFAVDFEFKSKLLNSLIGGMFTRASEKMISAFTARAAALYGEA